VGSTCQLATSSPSLPPLRSLSLLSLSLFSSFGFAAGEEVGGVDKLGADVLVMGSHGYGLFKRALLGSVSDYCVRNANCPVLIVKS
jgi:nucleotide-binding universal stress UspA family protein